jgi:hypothetical protein
LDFVEIIQAKQSLGFPQIYIIWTKYKSQKQAKPPLGFPQAYIISIKDKNKWNNPRVFHKRCFLLLFCFGFFFR